MTYYGAILHMAGYQADEAHIVRQYNGIVTECVIFCNRLFIYERVLDSRRGTQRVLYGY